MNKYYTIDMGGGKSACNFFEDKSPVLTCTHQGEPAVVEPIVLESNQNHATITNKGVSPTLSASMGLGGGYVPMVTEEKTEIKEEDIYSANKASFFTHAEKNIAGALVATDYKDPPMVAVLEELYTI